MIEWSSQQIGVINSRDNNTLVAASAGSGKTTVMLERLLRIITGDNFEKECIPVKNIVVVTFNTSVAQELRTKIARKLKEQLDMTSDSRHRAYLREQIEDIAVADISTMHALCGNIVRQNFEAVGVDPAFSLVDEEGKNAMFDKAVEDNLKKYRSDFSLAFENFNRYCTEYEFKETIKKFYEFVVAQPDRESYLDRTSLLCTSSNLDENELICKYVDKLYASLQNLVGQAEQVRAECKAAAYDEAVELCDNLINEIGNIARFTNFSQLLKVCPIQIDIIKPRRNKKDDEAIIAAKESYLNLAEHCAEVIGKINAYGEKDFDAHATAVSNCNKTIKILCDFTKDVISSYSAQKLQDDKLDFNDLEYYAIQALKNDDIAQSYRQKYKYVCVDEYQDINAVQEYILGRISNGNNLFMVGDSKQSIYAFRQTDTNIFLNKFDDYLQDGKLGEAHYLNANYRSSKEILQFVNLLFDEIMSKDFGGVDYKNTARLEQGQTAYLPTCENPVQVVLFESQQSDVEQDYFGADGVYSVRDHNTQIVSESKNEAVWIAKKINELVEKGTICQIVDNKPVSRKIEYRDIAILFASRNEDTQEVMDCLTNAGIPVDGSNAIKKDVDAALRQLVDLLKVLDNSRQDIALVSVMSGFFGGFSFGEIADVRRMGEQQTGKSAGSVYFFQYAYAVSETQSQLGKKVKAFFDFLDKYRTIQASLSVSRLMKKIIFDTNYDQYILMKEGGRQEYERLMAYVRALKGKSYDKSLCDFLLMADKLATTGDAGATQTNENCVKMTTMHASKGLEYPVVFAINMDKSFRKDHANQKFLMDKRYGVAMKSLDEAEGVAYDNVALDAMIDYKDRCSREEKMRLLYVALTRAKNMLFVTATVNSFDKPIPIVQPEESKSSLQWIVYAADKNAAFGQKYIIRQDVEIVESQKKNNSLKFRLLSDEQIEDFERALTIDYPYKESRNLGIKHTVTAINNIVAGGFDNEEYSKVGEIGKNQVGTALHKAMELIDLEIDSIQEVESFLDNLVENDQLSAEQRKLIDPQVIVKCLQTPTIAKARQYKHYREKKFVLNIPAMEVLPGVSCDDKILLQGTIDLLIELPDGYIVADFKYSGKSDEDIRRSYAKQLDLYKLAVESCSNKKVLEKVIVVIGDSREIKM
ncbi:MAG: UvrD-helicase domain-containing protein [Christensenellales bacterium]